MSGAKGKGAHQSEEINIDSNAKVSMGEDGAWVAAWVYVNHLEVRS